MYKRKQVLMDPWASLDRIFNNFTHTQDSGQSELSPKVHSCKTDDSLVLNFELPGVDPEKIELNYKDDILSLNAERIKPMESGTYLRRERVLGHFEKSLVLPFKVDEEKVQASYVNGILTVNLVKEAKQKTKKIIIKAQGAA